MNYAAIEYTIGERCEVRGRGEEQGEREQVHKDSKTQREQSTRTLESNTIEAQSKVKREDRKTQLD